MLSDPQSSPGTLPAQRSRAVWQRIKVWRTAYRVELLLFLLLWGTYAYFYQSAQHNEAARFDQMRAMVEEHTLSINHRWWNSADIIHYPKHGIDFVYPNKAPGGSLLGVIPFALVRLALKPFLWVGMPSWIYWHLVAYATILVTVGLLSAIAAVAIYRVILRVIDDRYIAVLAVLSIWLGTLALPYATLYFSHQLAGSLVTLGFASLFCWNPEGAEATLVDGLRFFLSGLLLGCAIMSEYPTLLLAMAISGYALWRVLRARTVSRGKLELLLAYLTGATIAGAILIGYNVLAYGNWKYVPVEAYASATSQFPTYAHGLLGFQWNGFAKFLHALACIAVYPKIGSLYLGVEHWVVYGCSPILWLAVPGVVVLLWWRETRPEGFLILAMIIAYLLFITSYGTWEYDWAGGSYFGSRHLVPLFGVLALPVAVVMRRLLFLAYPLLAISVFYMLLGTAVEPRVGYPTDNPHRDIFLPEFLRGHLAQNIGPLFDDDHHLLTKDSTAFNLGKLARLPARHQLAPLMLWWSLIGAALILRCSRSEAGAALTGKSVPVFRRRVRGLLAFTIGITLLPIVHHAALGARQGRSGLHAKYYRNVDWSGRPSETQVDRAVDFDWSKTFPLQPPFSVEWSGSIFAQQAGTYSFGVIADDGAAVEIDGKTVVDALHVVLQKRTGTIALSHGAHRIRVRYFNALFGGSIRLTYIPPGRDEQVVPETVLTPGPVAPLRH